jgi:hypothetical protein
MYDPGHSPLVAGIVLAPDLVQTDQEAVNCNACLDIDDVLESEIAAT